MGWIVGASFNGVPSLHGASCDCMEPRIQKRTSMERMDRITIKEGKARGDRKGVIQWRPNIDAHDEQDENERRITRNLHEKMHE